MKKKKAVNDGGGAFPFCMWYGDHHAGHNLGITVRDYFAAKALQGILAYSGDPFDPYSGSMKRNIEDDVYTACKYADAMLRARDARGGGGG